MYGFTFAVLPAVRGFARVLLKIICPPISDPRDRPRDFVTLISGDYSKTDGIAKH